ncbi:recombinase family protein [Bacillus sp. 1P06AnD]|uniref:recombinase family protein n=1 Tax=Bacillus sp. 1P06AnD TaxID=3132208 RepID=UPI0039A3628D
MKIGYARVSSKDQNLARQIKELENYGCEKIITEKQSGKNFYERTKYLELKKKLRFGDILVVHSLSRFGRNKEEIIKEWKSLVDAEIDIVVLDMPALNTAQYRGMKGIGSLVSEIFLQVMSWMVETERDNIKQAQREGIELAKQIEGKYTGRKTKYCPSATGKDKLIYDTIVSDLKSKVSVMDVHRKTGVSRNTIYKIKSNINIIEEKN